MSKESRNPNKLFAFVFEPVSLYPMVALRLAFGLAMAIWTIYMLLSGTVEEFFIKPEFYFSYPGFDWLQPLPTFGMYAVFILLLITSFQIFAGYFFRLGTVLFIVLFTYITLVDRAGYLSYYYYVLLLAFMLCISPANRLFSIDLIRNPASRVDYVPRWSILAFKMQVALVFLFAGMAKMNHDWLNEGRPVNLWLKSLADSDFWFFPESLTTGLFPIVVSWLLLMFDFIIPHFLFDRKTASGAVLFVMIIQGVALYLFPAGFFPVLIALSSLIFLPEQKVNSFLSRIADFMYDIFEFKNDVFKPGGAFMLQYRKKKLFPLLLALFFGIQVLLPVGLFLNWGSKRWADSAFRFSWDIRLQEKKGEVNFFMLNNQTKEEITIPLQDFLTEHQIRVMAEDSSMIRQFAEHLINTSNFDISKGNYILTTNSLVSLNGNEPKLVYQNSWEVNK